MDHYLRDLSEHFARMRPRLEVVAARILGNHSEAADVVSEVYLSLMRTPPRTRDALPAWLFVSVRNRALKRLRSQQTVSLSEADPAATVEPNGSEAAAVAEVLSEAIQRLSARDMAFVTARFYEGASTETLASEHHVTRAQARIILHRAIARLRRGLVEELAAHHGVPDEHREAVAAMVAKGEFKVDCLCSACRRLDDEISALRKLRGILPLGLSKGWLKKAVIGVGTAIIIGAPVGRVPDAAGEPLAPTISAPEPAGLEDSTVQDLPVAAAQPRTTPAVAAVAPKGSSGGRDPLIPRVPKTNSSRPFSYKTPLGVQAPPLSLPAETDLLPDVPKVRGLPTG